METDIDGKFNLGWRDSGTRIIYIDLKSPEENYGPHPDDNAFEFALSQIQFPLTALSIDKRIGHCRADEECEFAEF